MAALSLFGLIHRMNQGWHRDMVSRSDVNEFWNLVATVGARGFSGYESSIASIVSFR